MVMYQNNIGYHEVNLEMSNLKKTFNNDEKMYRSDRLYHRGCVYLSKES